MSANIYKNLLKITLYLFLVSAVQQVFSQELWTPTSTGTNVPIGRFEHTVVWTGIATNKMIIWGGANSSGVTNTGGIYDIASDSWSVTSTGANCPTARHDHTCVWSGTKMIVWGGYDGNFVYNSGGVYDPVLNTWTVTSNSGAPHARFFHTAVWTGTKMIVWGGTDAAQDTSYNTGGIYDPLTDTWTAMSTINAPSPRLKHSAIWTGSKMIIWGGKDVFTQGSTQQFNTGGIYDPVSDTWTSTSITNAPAACNKHTAIWTGSKMIIWGGVGNSNTYYNTGGIYDPVTDTWTATSLTSAPLPRYYHTAVWTGSRMIVWGGGDSFSQFNTGGIYDPVADSWAVTSTVNAPATRTSHTMIITPNSMIVFGGSGSSGFYNSGGVYTNPSIIGITPVSTEIPEQFSLSQNYPNPFNPNSKIKFQIAKLSNAKLVVLDVLGREVTTLVNEQLKPGTYEADFDGSKFSSGVYFYKITAGDFSQTKKMILVK